MENYLNKLLYGMLILILTSCADVSDNTSNSTPNIIYQEYTLTWTEPDGFDNGEDLSAIADLQGYRIYYGDSEENVTENHIDIDVINSFSTSDLDLGSVTFDGTIYLAMTSVSNDGVESVLSEIITFIP